MAISEERSADKAAERPTVFAPLYRQIRQLIVSALDQGEWKPGELIPSEMDLAVRFQVSQGTVRKAIDELAAENLLVRRQGKGTFVATHHEARAQYRFLRLQPDSGPEVPAQSRFLECRRIRASAEIAAQLELKTGDPVVFVRRLLSFESVPTVLDDIWLPGAAFRGLTAERLSQYHGPLYGLFETEFGTQMIHATEKLKAVLADDTIAAQLNVGSGVPVLGVERVAYTYGERPVELRRAIYVTTNHHYHNELS